MVHIVSDDISLVHSSYKSSAKILINLISVLARLSQRRTVPPNLDYQLPQAVEDFDSSDVQYYLRHPTVTGFKILFVFSRQNMAHVKTNQTSRQLPEQIKIFEIINAKTDLGTFQRQTVKSAHFNNL